MIEKPMFRLFVLLHNWTRIYLLIDPLTTRDKVYIRNCSDLMVFHETKTRDLVSHGVVSFHTFDNEMMLLGYNDNLDERSKMKIKLIVAFLGIKSAYDSVDRSIIRQYLHQHFLIVFTSYVITCSNMSTSRWSSSTFNLTLFDQKGDSFKVLLSALFYTLSSSTLLLNDYALTIRTLADHSSYIHSSRITYRS